MIMVVIIIVVIVFIEHFLLYRDRPVWRALRRAVPMQTLALVLIGFASLIPMANDDYACLFENYFASSFNPMLKFQGTPPF